MLSIRRGSLLTVCVVVALACSKASQPTGEVISPAGEPSTADANVGRSAEQRCRDNETVACNQAGEEKEPFDSALAVELFRRACDSGIKDGCVNWARVVLRGAPSQALAGEARKTLQDNCTSGSHRACVVVADAKLKSAAKTEVKSALLLFEKACEGGFAPGCRRLGEMFDDGGAAAKNPNRARELYDRACTGSDGRGCLLLGVTHYDAKERTQAQVYFEKACELRNGAGCDIAAIAYGSKGPMAQDSAKALNLRRKACQYAWPDGCLEAGTALVEGDGASPDKLAALGYFKTGCALGSGESCFNAGVLRHESGDPVEALGFFKQACARGYGGGCSNAGAFLDRGLAGSEDPSKAVEYFDRGCKAKEMTACRNLGVMYEKGRGVKQDLARAKKEYKRACDGGNKEACSSLLERPVDTYVPRDATPVRSQADIRACEERYRQAIDRCDTDPASESQYRSMGITDPAEMRNLEASARDLCRRSNQYELEKCRR